MMLEIFDLMTMPVQNYENRRVNVFYETEHQVFITEPATLAIESVNGARLMGIQIKVE